MKNELSFSSGQSGGTGEAGGRKRKRNRWGDEADKGTFLGLPYIQNVLKLLI